MKFDYVIGNPPYQEDTAGAGRQAKPVYQHFINEASKLNPEAMVMITPSRWFSGGMGLEEFRSKMLNNKHISKIVDYTNSKDCFPDISISGGVNYFSWKKNPVDKCLFTNITNGESSTMERCLDEFPTLVRYNKAVAIIHKVQNKMNSKLDEIISSLMPYGLSTSYRGEKNKKNNYLRLFASNGITYVPRNVITKGFETVDKYKILVSKTGAEHAGEPGKDGKFRVIPSSMQVICPGDICTHSYFVIGQWDNDKEANNCLSYLQTKFVRFLMLICMSGYGLSKLVFPFVPMQNFSKAWTDDELYKKYDLSHDDIEYIEATIKPYKGDGVR